MYGYSFHSSLEPSLLRRRIARRQQALVFERDAALLFDELDVERDGDFITDHESARFKGRVPDEAEVFAVDFCGGLDAMRCRPMDPSWRAGASTFRVTFESHHEFEVSLDREFATFFFANFAGLKAMLGNFSTSKKSALFRCVSRCGSRVLMLLAST